MSTVFSELIKLINENEDLMQLPAKGYYIEPIADGSVIGVRLDLSEHVENKTND